MPKARQCLLNACERAGAALLLLSLAPFMAAVWLVWNQAGETPLQDHTVKRPDGTAVSTWRFRTTGRHTDGLDSFGGFLIRHGIDEWPGLVSAVKGELRLGDLPLLRRRG
jgi:hypothetical protein